MPNQDSFCIPAETEEAVNSKAVHQLSGMYNQSNAQQIAVMDTSSLQIQEMIALALTYEGYTIVKHTYRDDQSEWLKDLLDTPRTFSSLI